MSEFTNAVATETYMIKDAHERMQYDACSVSDAELVALVLRGAGTCAAHATAVNLLTGFGSLRRLMTASADAIHVDARVHVTLQAALELARRHYGELMRIGPALSNPRATREYLRMRLRDLEHEVFGICMLDNRNRVISVEEVFRGTIDGASVHPREIVKLALAKNAAGIICFHNHPSGIAEPSRADELITRRLKDALALVEIRVLDHLIIGDDACESFADRGLL